jgi:adenylate cyclase
MYCSACFKWLHKHQAGAEIECSLLFADVRGSTTIAEHMRPAAFRQLMEQFFARSSQVIVDADGLVDKFVGDEVVAIFIPALTGADHARRAIDAARRVVSLMAGEDGAHLLPSAPESTPELHMLGRWAAASRPISRRWAIP